MGLDHGIQTCQTKSAQKKAQPAQNWEIRQDVDETPTVHRAVVGGAIETVFQKQNIKVVKLFYI